MVVRVFVFLLMGSLGAGLGPGLAQDASPAGSGIEVRVVERIFSGVPNVPPAETQVLRQIAVAPSTNGVVDYTSAQLVQTVSEGAMPVALAPGSYWVGAASAVPSGDPAPAPATGEGTALPPSGGFVGVPSEGTPGVAVPDGGGGGVPNPSGAPLIAQTVTVEGGQFAPVTLYIDRFAPSAPPGFEPEPEPTVDPVHRWRVRYFTPEELADAAAEDTIWGPKADPDGDRIENEIEYALGLHPRESESFQDAVQLQVSESGFSLSILQRRNDERVRYVVESAPRVGFEAGTVVGVEPGAREAFDRDYEWVTYQEDLAGARFYRIQIGSESPAN